MPPSGPTTTNRVNSEYVPYPQPPTTENNAVPNPAAASTDQTNHTEVDKLGCFDDAEIFEADVDEKKAGDNEIKAALEKYGKSYSSSGFFSSVGRFLQKICRNIREFFCGKMEIRNIEAKGSEVYNEPEVAATDSTVTFGEVLNSHKISEDKYANSKIISYSDLNLETASLNDIKQRAALQDCWLLASISSVLVTIGPDNLSKIIKDKGDGNFSVRLANKNYTVPAKEMSYDDGGKTKNIFSDSAPWVNVLECAMRMKFIEDVKSMSANSLKDAREVQSMLKLDFRTPTEALMALMPGKLGVPGAVDKKSANDKFTYISDALQENKPVVLGKVTGYAASLFTDGVAVGHAVAVIGVDREKGTVDIFDPYGRLIRLTTDQLSNFNVMTVVG